MKFLKDAVLAVLIAKDDRDSVGSWLKLKKRATDLTTDGLFKEAKLAKIHSTWLLRKTKKARFVIEAGENAENWLKKQQSLPCTIRPIKTDRERKLFQTLCMQR